MFNRKQRKARLFSIFAVLMITIISLFASISSGDSKPDPISDLFSPYALCWTYKINIGGNTEDNPVFIDNVTDANGDVVENLTSSGVGSWGWDENFEYGPFGSYYAAFDVNGRIICHVRADDLNTSVGSEKGTDDLKDKGYNIMWVLPTVYWSSDENGNLTLSNDPSKGTAYAHTIDGKVYSHLAIGVYETSVIDGKARSLPGVGLDRMYALASFRRASEGIIDTDGDGVLNGYSMQWNYFQWSLYRYCVFASLGTFDSQSFSHGNVSRSTLPGLTNVSGSEMPQGYYTEGSSEYTATRLFLENTWGSMPEFVDNVVIKDGAWFVGQTHNASNDLADKINNTTITTVSNFSGCARTITTNEINWGLPSLFGGSSSVGLADGYYQDRGEKSLQVGGAWGAGGGVSWVSALSDLGEVSRDFGSRMSFVFDADPASSQECLIICDFGYGGIPPTKVIVEKGKKMVLSSPDRQQWGFAGWFFEDSGVKIAGSEIIVFGDFKLTARWVRQAVNLVLHYNIPDTIENNEIYETIVVKIKSSPESLMPEDPVREGYTFGGWYNESECITPFDSTAIMLDDGEIFAKWVDEQNKGEINITLFVIVGVVIAIGFLVIRRI